MSQEIVIISAEEVVKAFESAGKSAKQIEQLKFELSTTPLTGRIQRFVTEPKEFKTKDTDGKSVVQKYFVFEVADDKGKIIGDLPVSRPFDTYVNEGDYLICGENSTNKGKAMLRSHRMNELSGLGKSKAEQIANMVGKSYSATKVTKRIPKSYTTSDLFVTASADGKVSDSNIAKLNKNTVAKDLLSLTFEE